MTVTILQAPLPISRQLLRLKRNAQVPHAPPYACQRPLDSVSPVVIELDEVLHYAFVIAEATGDIV